PISHHGHPTRPAGGMLGMGQRTVQILVCQELRGGDQVSGHSLGILLAQRQQLASCRLVQIACLDVFRELRLGHVRSAWASRTIVLTPESPAPSRPVVPLIPIAALAVPLAAAHSWPTGTLPSFLACVAAFPAV